MNTPTPLSWLLQASPQQLSAFCEHNPALVTLLFDSWQKFQQEHADLFVQAAFAAAEPYAPGFSPDDLSHSPITPEEMAEFLRVFDSKQTRGQIFPQDIEIIEQDWEILDSE
jgi:hypothetical protein